MACDGGLQGPAQGPAGGARPPIGETAAEPQPSSSEVPRSQPASKPAELSVRTVPETSCMTTAYKRLKAVNVDDITLRIHEALDTIDAIWLKRLLVDLAGQYIDDLKEPDQQQILTLGKDTDGTTLLLIEMMRPYISSSPLCWCGNPVILTCRSRFLCWTTR